jgi:hypothetical protein
LLCAALSLTVAGFRLLLVKSPIGQFVGVVIWFRQLEARKKGGAILCCMVFVETGFDYERRLTDSVIEHVILMVLNEARCVSFGRSVMLS